MKNKFDYQSVPYGFAHCFHSQCIHKEECLHHLAAINCTSQYPTLSIINPNRIPADTTDCPYFRKAQKYRVAWGIRHLLDNVPHKCAAPMRNQLVGHFGKTTYYRFYRQEQGLFPKANAKQFLVIQKEFGSFYNYTLSFFPDRNPIINHFQSLSEIPVSSPESDAMSKDMKKRGFKFFGSTICYAHLQASGFINDHLTDCICRNQKQ